MKMRGGFEQCYNAQAAVEVTTMLIGGERDTQHANDKQQLVPTLAAISPVIQRVSIALVDSGYYSGSAVLTSEAADPATTVYAAMKRQSHSRSVAQLEARQDPPPPEAPVAERIASRLDLAQGKHTVGPVFAIIKQAISFRRFLLRGQEKAGLEWTLVTTSYNLKRLFNLGMSLSRA